MRAPLQRASEPVVAKQEVVACDGDGDAGGAVEPVVVAGAHDAEPHPGRPREPEHRAILLVQTDAITTPTMNASMEWRLGIAAYGLARSRGSGA